MDWIVAPWIALLATGWLLALVFHATCLLPARARAERDDPAD